MPDGPETKYFRAAARKERQDAPKLSAAERAALVKLRREARHAGATLASGGKGGLPPSLVLGVMRRDGYRCQKCGTPLNVTVHHRGGVENPITRWLAGKGHSNDPSNLVTLCIDCHDNVHEADRARGDTEGS